MTQRSLMFDLIPNKRPKATEFGELDVWPEHSGDVEINRFYRCYISAEGWVGEGYLMIWPREDIAAFEAVNAGAYPDKYKFFGSDGGGTQFGFCNDRGEIAYIAAPDIGQKGDIKVLGSWQDFMECVARNEYI